MPRIAPPRFAPRRSAAPRYGPDEVLPAEVRAAEVRVGEVRSAEVRPAEVRPPEVPPELHLTLPFTEVRGPATNVQAKLTTPLVPGSHALLEQCDLLVVSHRIIQGA
jgi:hypothetical protein